ncbi:hypothetical protein [Candidatus Nitrosotenuis cloacae]|uniref:hypothetical protein n=1 Tax=Candidatus Nitrosotenuis cloacae TaxID=1603555 RepID=UPI00227E4C01|nr:hypothetical protein [Candidatus Nitrosotenuis cloacae]
MTERCALCGLERELRDSHIIPKFVGKWLKKTSATGYLAKATRASHRVQDLGTLRLLCSECEERLSKFEQYFANDVFFPFHEKKKNSFEYDERLELFAISLSWRAIKSCEKYDLDQPEFNSLLEQAESDWREFLLGRRKTITPYENYLFFLDYTDTPETPQKFNWYALRSVDATLAESKTKLFVYVKLPWMVFVSTIFPTSMEGWEDTIMRKDKTLTIPQSVKDGDFGRFLMDRAKLALTSSTNPTPELSQNRLLRAIEKDRKKFLESDTLMTMIAEGDLRRKQKMKLMPKSIIALVDEAIIPSADEPNLDKAENQTLRWEFRKIADELANLSKEDATNLNKTILSTIHQAKTLQTDTRNTFETSKIWITFMVNQNATKEYQRSQIIKEIERLKGKQTDDTIHLAVFSMNPSSDGVSFESAFSTGSREEN